MSLLYTLTQGEIITCGLILSGQHLVLAETSLLRESVHNRLDRKLGNL